MEEVVKRRDLLGSIGVCASAVVVTACVSQPLGQNGRVEAALGGGGQCGEPDPESYLDWSDPAAWQSGVPGPGDVAEVHGPIKVSGNVTVAGIEILEGGTLCFDPLVSTTVQSKGNVVVDGRLILRPDNIDVQHTLRFVGASGSGVDEGLYVGGGMQVLPTDHGLWVRDGGILDARGTPRVGWNRTGDDPTWDWVGNTPRPKDVIRQAPIAAGVTSFAAPLTAPVTPGSEQFEGTTYTTETFNLTRNVEICGMAPDSSPHRAHVMFLHCSNRQYIEYVSFRYLAPANKTGRYAVHFHHCGEGVRGTVVRGVVAQDCGGHAFVPHASRGITFEDCIAYKTTDVAYWWDPDAPGAAMGNASHDIVYRHCAAFSGNFKSGGFLLGHGTGNQCTDCVVVGNTDGSNAAAGFQWDDAANFKPNVWQFTGCVAHNNASFGLRVWQNDDSDHVIENFVAFHNQKNGIEHGAYGNRYRYRNVVAFNNNGLAAFVSKAQSNNVGFITMERMTLAAPNFRVFTIGEHSGEPDNPQRIVDCRFLSGTAQPIAINERVDLKLGRYDFIRARVGTEGRDLEPTDFQLFVVHPSSVFRVERRDGTAYQLTLVPSSNPPQLQVTNLPDFTLSNALT